jgi:hypothetical protein
LSNILKKENTYKCLMQNDDEEEMLRKGAKVVLSWEPIFTFALDGSENVSAGSH